MLLLNRSQRTYHNDDNSDKNVNWIDSTRIWMKNYKRFRYNKIVSSGVHE